MRLEKLKKIYQDCRYLPHYQYKDLTEEELLKKALVSFERIPKKQQDKVWKSWATKINKTVASLTQEDINDLLKYRFLSQTNLFFLCHLLEKYDRVTVNTHEEICNSFFVQKDPTFLTFDHFQKQYTDLKERLLLTPRGAFKSSCNMADCVQWTICFPAITILVLTGVYKLAGDFVGEMKQHFTLELTSDEPVKGKLPYGPRQLMDKETGEWTDSLFQVLFPEHCVIPTEGSQFEFQTPAGGDDKEPTIRAASIEQSLSGMHVMILCLDDTITNENSQTPTRVETVNKQISINKALLNPGGFIQKIGTWYVDEDDYGNTIAQEEKFLKEQGIPESETGSVDSGRFNSNTFTKVYLRACWWPTEEAKKSGRIEDEMTEKDYVLFFPEVLSYKFLSDEKVKDNDRGNFAIKYLNNPRKANTVKFPRELLVRRTIPHTQFPPNGIVVTAVDTAYSVKQWADYTVILTALIFGGRFYIINMVRGRFNEFDLPKVIATSAFKWKPKRIAIEDSVGVKWMGRELRREMDKLQISIPVEYCTLGFGSKLRSKQLKAKPVLRLLGDERLYFLNSCEGLEEIYNEMGKFTGTSDDEHDDIVSAISLLVEQFGGYADMDAKINSVNQTYVADAKSKNMHDMIYCLGKYAKYNELGTIEENPITNYQMNQINSLENSHESYNDPLADLYR